MVRQGTTIRCTAGSLTAPHPRVRCRLSPDPPLVLIVALYVLAILVGLILPGVAVALYFGIDAPALSPGHYPTVASPVTMVLGGQMTSVVPKRRARSGSRRLGYLIAAAVNGVMLYAVNVWPGWEILPFLTEETPLILGLVNLALVAGVIINLVNLALDLAPVKALGDLILLGIGLVVLARAWQVFPFDFANAGFDWALLVHAILAVAFIGSIIGIVAQLVVFIRSLSGRTDERP